MTDARFEDGAEAPLRLKAEGSDDLPVISALVQDAVFPISEMRFESRRRRFALLLNRFRWELQPESAARGGYERVQSVLVVEDVQGVATQGIDRTDRDTILSLLSIGFEPGTDGAGRLVLVLAGDGAIALDVECLDVTLRDVTRPYRAPSGKAPRHPD
jgi:hypothetical protein